ncbi:hypothetical protein ZHAS_00005878 [Anopheles sinensis]|uniref:Uncharacterized protein n=1 Tax=Anopheles sinensis TaxID=74873 RepID=A0A084VKI1_ANOSI|nr:hypothetical protein ZHAS_00005878 [Anopheles sinensis]
MCPQAHTGGESLINTTDLIAGGCRKSPLAGVGHVRKNTVLAPFFPPDAPTLELADVISRSLLAGLRDYNNSVAEPELEPKGFVIYARQQKPSSPHERAKGCGTLDARCQEYNRFNKCYVLFIIDDA